MILTPEEAKKKLCCNARNSECSNLRCRADECMAWKWDLIEVAGSNKLIPKYVRGERGYCGLVHR